MTYSAHTDPFIYCIYELIHEEFGDGNMNDIFC